MNKIKRNFGVTMIEALISSVIITLGVSLFMMSYKESLKNDLIKEFEYDFKNVIKGYEEKIIEDNLVDKKYWVDYPFDKDYNSHIIRNLTDVDSNCQNLSIVDLNGKNYMKCIEPVMFKVFNVNINGDINFYKNNSLKVYSVNFTPKKVDELKDLKLLHKAIKRVFNNSSFYSNVSFFSKNERVDYSKCLASKEYCYLRLTFGSTANYLDEENNNVIIKEYSSDVINYSNSNDYLNGNNDNNKNIYDIRDARDKEQKLKDQLKVNGLDLNDKEFYEFKKSVDKLSKDPKFVESVEERLKKNCSIYDEDDYYFMSKYEKENECYKKYGK